ncbi:hypothetical protein R6M67_09330 [Streptomyces sp. Wh19]|nr:hypothetical protein [Streptomyces sp. Wh19]
MRHPDILTDSQHEQIDRIPDACPDLAMTATSRASSAPSPTNTEARNPHSLDDTSPRRGTTPVQGFAAFLQNTWDAVVNDLTQP